jgi:folate-binding protein YgfZ
MQGETDEARIVAVVEGADALPFLQGLVTNDVLPLSNGPGIVWCALLTPQGKYLADFFVVATDGRLLIDLPAQLADSTLRRLAMYRLRAKVQITTAAVPVSRGTGPAPAGALPDPRHPALGWRLYGHVGGSPGIDWDAIRVEHIIPETGRELIPDDTYILETGFERLHGVDFRKGCYVGQEVTARMKHKTELRKGLTRVQIDGPAAEGTTITTPDGREAGVLHTRSGDRALAWLRFDRAVGQLVAGAAKVAVDAPAEV